LRAAGDGHAERNATASARTPLVALNGFASQIGLLERSDMNSSAETAEKSLYPPLNTLKPVAQDIWIVDSGPINAMGISLPIRMTIIRLSSGEAWLHSPTRYAEDLHAAIEREVGPIGHLVAPNVAHWTFAEQWQRHCPAARMWGSPELRKRKQVRNSGLRIDSDLGDTAPAEWRDDIEQRVIRGGLGVTETTFLHRASRTLILTDLVQNLEPEKVGPIARLFFRLAGSLAPDGMAPAYLRAIIKLNAGEARAAAREIAGWEPERLLFTHGRWFARNGAAELRRSWRWLIG
jgi:hypothetical protein